MSELEFLVSLFNSLKKGFSLICQAANERTRGQSLSCLYGGLGWTLERIYLQKR